MLVSEMTREEYQALKQELENLKTVQRNEISEKIRIARGFGDLSENSEYMRPKTIRRAWRRGSADSRSSSRT
jgi:transcription elongation factor GreA